MFAFAAATIILRARRRDAQKRCQANNKQKIFHKILLLSFPIIFGDAIDRVPTGCSGELSSRRRNWRTLRARYYAIVVYRYGAAHLHSQCKHIGATKIKQQANRGTGAARGRARGHSAGVDWTAGTRVHVHVRATSLVLCGWKRFAWKNRR